MFRRRGARRSPRRRREQTGAGAGSSLRPPEPCPPQDAADVIVRRSPGAGRSSLGTSCLSGFGPRQCRDAGLASRCGAGSSRVIRVISVIVIISLFPVVLCLSTTFRPAHYNAGERRSQDKDLKGWWVEKQGSKGTSPSRAFRMKPQFGATSQSRARLPGVNCRMTYRWQSRTCYMQ